MCQPPQSNRTKMIINHFFCKLIDFLQSRGERFKMFYRKNLDNYTLISEHNYLNINTMRFDIIPVPGTRKDPVSIAYRIFCL